MIYEEKLALIKEEYLRMTQKSWWKRLLFFIMLKLWEYLARDIKEGS